MEEELSRAAARRRWPALIKRVYEVDPLRCPKCGGEMRVIAFIERRQRDVIRKILEHCGLWEEPRAPASAQRRWSCAKKRTPTTSPRRKNHSHWHSTLAPLPGRGIFALASGLARTIMPRKPRMSTTTATTELARQAERGFSFGGTLRPSHRPDGLRPQGGEKAANQRRTVRQPESKFLSRPCKSYGQCRMEGMTQ
jgi:hypothetical protein